jgi:hypothetical protein
MQKLPEIKSVAKDNTDIIIQSSFEGGWLPSVSPLKIGDNNFSDCNNISYNKYGVISVKGHVVFNVTPITTYTYGRAGHQLRVPNPLTGTKSYIIVQQHNDACTASQLFINTTIPPAIGNYDSGAFLNESSGFGQGYFTESPGNQLVYSNGVQTLIYGGKESTISGFIVADSCASLSPVNPINYTNEMMNASPDTLVTLTSGKVYLIGATRPMCGFTPYIAVPNHTYSADAQVDEWNGTSWNAVSNLIDGSYDWGRTHYKTGEITFDSTVNTCKPAYICDQLLYWYRVLIPSGTCQVSLFTVDMPLQPLVNLWDGVNRVCIQCEVYQTDHFEDYTPEVYDVSSSAYPIAANFSGLPTGTGKIILMFKERTTAIRFAFPAGFVNKVSGTNATIKYWNGTSYSRVGYIYDGTYNVSTNASAGQTGVMYWDAPPADYEIKKNEFGVIGYSYELTFDETLTVAAGTAPYYTSGVFADTIYGIPAPSTMGNYKFAFTYRNRLFLAGDLLGKEGHAIDYGVTGVSDAFNGPDSSADGRRLYVGDGSSDLTCAVNIFNRYGAAMFDSEILLKPHETYILDGESPNSTTNPFRINKISDNIGCPAPNTLCTAEVAFEMSKDVIRNVALWISAIGPVIFDAAVLSPIAGIECYFDEFDTRYINYDYFNRSHAWFDPSDYNWNVCIPSGYNILLSGEISGVTLLNPHCAEGTYTLDYIA